MDVLVVVAPIFFLIAAGLVAARFGYLSQTAQAGITEFSFKLAIPALLFRMIATGSAAPTDPARLWLAYFGAVAIVWLSATVATSLLLRRPQIDAPTVAMTAVYGNVVMIGIPICFGLFGEAAATPMAIILSVHSPLMWLAATLHQQWSGRTGAQSASALLKELVLSLARNALIVAILLGSLWRLLDIGLDPVADGILKLLGQAGIPCALVALGMSLTRFRIAGQLPTLSAVLALKLAVMPAVAWVLAVWLLALPKVTAGVVLVFAAMPAGANAYLFAERTGRVVNSTSGAIALGTLLSVGTITLLIASLGHLLPAD